MLVTITIITTTTNLRRGEGRAVQARAEESDPKNVADDAREITVIESKLIDIWRLLYQITVINVRTRSDLRRNYY